METFLEDWNLA